MQPIALTIGMHFNLVCFFMLYLQNFLIHVD